MNNFYNIHKPVIMVAMMLLMAQVSFAQERLSNSSNEPAGPAFPVIYAQPVTDIPAPITDPVLVSPDTPRFIQTFSQDRSALSAEPEAPVAGSGPARDAFREDPLPLDDQGIYSGSFPEAIACDDTPIGTDDSYVTGNDQELSIAAPGFLANDIDLEGEALTATTLVDDADHGSLAAFADGSFTYTPDEGFVGTDQFQYLMQDASGNPSEPVTVTIEVREAANRAPIGSADVYGALSGTTLSVAAPGFLGNDIDQDGDVLSATTLVDDVDQGTLSAFVDGSFSYTPNPGYTGIDQFQYEMRDSEFNTSGPITVTIEVFPGNRNPLGTDDLFGVVVNTSLTIPAPGFLINDIDPDGDLLTATTLVDDADNGSLSAFVDGSFTYTPDPGFTGIDQFQYEMQDSEFNTSGPITVTLEVIGTGVLPFAFADTYRTADGTTLTVAAPGFLLNDVDQDGEPLTAISILDDVDNGTLAAFADGSFTYTPNAGFTGTDQFQYRMQDASSNQSEAIVTIVVEEPFNRVPVGLDDMYGALANTTLTIATPGFLGNDIDPDGDELTAISIVENVDHGTLSAFVDGSFNYTPNAGFTGTDQFQYKMQDALSNQSDPITVTIEVYEGNRAPSGTDDLFAVVKDTPLSIAAAGFLANDYDPDGDALAGTSILDNVDHGSLSAFADGSFTYTPDAGFTGTDQFIYEMQDSELNQSNPVTVTLEVVGPNLPPVASAADITVECTGPAGTTVTLDGTGSSDPEEGALMYTWYENGSVIAGPSTSPTADVTLGTGTYTVTLVVEDECGETSSDDATVTIEDSSAPLVEAAFLQSGSPNEFEISCFSEDLCSEIIASSSVILIPTLTDPTVSLKNSPVYSLGIDTDKNEVTVKAPDAAAFWGMIMMMDGVPVNDGQVITAKDEKNKYKFGFNAQGDLVSVKGEIVTLRCIATDSDDNTGMGEATLPPDMLKSLAGTAENTMDGEFTGEHRNYPNPFLQSTTIEFRLEQSSFVTVRIFDQLGRMVDELENRLMPEGIHQITWDASGYDPGMYVYRIQYEGNLLTGRMMHTRQ